MIIKKDKIRFNFMLKNLSVIFLCIISYVRAQSNRFERIGDTIYWDFYQAEVNGEFQSGTTFSYLSLPINRKNFTQLFVDNTSPSLSIDSYKEEYFLQNGKVYNIKVKNLTYYDGDCGFQLNFESSRKNSALLLALLKEKATRLTLETGDTLDLNQSFCHLFETQINGFYNLLLENVPEIKKLYVELRLDTVRTFKDRGVKYPNEQMSLTWITRSSGGLELLTTKNVSPFSYIKYRLPKTEFPVLKFNGKVMPYKITISEANFDLFRRDLMLEKYSLIPFLYWNKFMGYDSTSQYYFLGHSLNTGYLENVVRYDTVNYVDRVLVKSTELIKPIEYKYFGKDTLPYFVFIEYKRENDTVLSVYSAFDEMYFSKSDKSNYKLIGDKYIYSEDIGSNSETKRKKIYKYYYDSFIRLSDDEVEKVLDTLELKKY